jgi:hypothetical protein
MKSALLLFVAMLISGCAAGRLYPIQGPLAAQAPPPIFKVKMENYDGISIKLNGEVCAGSWLGVVQEDPTARDLAAEWDLVYGKGFFLANVLGHPGIARAILHCPKDRTVMVEFNSRKGVAKDGDDNVFKLTF